MKLRFLVTTTLFIFCHLTHAQVTDEEANEYMIGQAMRNIERCAAGLDQAGDFYKRFGATLSMDKGHLVLDFDGERLPIANITRLKGIDDSIENKQLFLLSLDKEKTQREYSSLVCIAKRGF